MRFLRFVALMLAVAIAYSAQAILHPSALTAPVLAFLNQVSNFIPSFLSLSALFLGKTRDLAFLWLAIAAATFGLLAAPWPLTDRSPAAAVANAWTTGARRRQHLAWVLIIVGLLCSLAAALAAWVQILTTAEPPSWIAILSSSATLRLSLPATVVDLAVPLLNQAPWLTIALWAASLLCFLLGCSFFPVHLQPTATEEATRPSQNQAKPASGGWSRFLLLLTFAALQVGWRLTDIPSFVNPAVAQIGLAANDWLRTGDISLFFATPMGLEPGLTSFSQLPLTMPAFFFYLTTDLLVSTRLAGLWAVLLVLTATWLLGTELFRRVPHRLAPELSEDQGQWPALVATVLVMFTVATLLFSRFPILLEMVGWGSLGCWALLRGWRTNDRLAIGLSGVLIGLSTLIYPPGIAFVLIALCWWIGFSFVQWGWVPQRAADQHTGALFRGHFVVWLLGLWLVAAPTVGAHCFALGNWRPALPGNLANWQTTFLAFGQQGDLSTVGGWSIPLLHELFAPLFVLALGALIFNLDRRVGWLLLTWLGGGVLYAIVLSARAPLWPALLPVLPATGLVLAFGIDRLRTTILQSAGPWLRNLVNYLLAGLILWVGFTNGTAYYHFAHQQADAVSTLGYELRMLPAGRDIIVIAPIKPAGVASDAPQLRFLTNDWLTPPLAMVTFRETVPAAAPPGAVIFIAPADPLLLGELQARYPDGNLFVRRDHLANPLLYRYTLPNQP